MPDHTTSPRRDFLEGIRAVLADMDGTLVAVPHDWTAIRRELGVGPGSILAQLDAFPEPERTRRFQQLEAIERAACREARPAPGAERFLELLEERGLPVALVTNNSQESVRDVLERTGWRFPVMVARDDGPPKPSPEPLLRAAALLGVPIEECAFVGDAWLDWEAARAAGCRAIWLLGPAARSHGDEATLAAEDLSALLAMLEPGLNKRRGNP